MTNLISTTQARFAARTGHTAITLNHARGFSPTREELIASGRIRPQEGFVSRAPSLSDRRAVLPIAGARQWGDQAWAEFFGDDDEGGAL